MKKYCLVDCHGIHCAFIRLARGHPLLILVIQYPIHFPLVPASGHSFATCTHNISRIHLEQEPKHLVLVFWECTTLTWPYFGHVIIGKTFQKQQIYTLTTEHMHIRMPISAMRQSYDKSIKYGMKWKSPLLRRFESRDLLATCRSVLGQDTEPHIASNELVGVSLPPLVSDCLPLHMYEWINHCKALWA